MLILSNDYLFQNRLAEYKTFDNAIKCDHVQQGPTRTEESSKSDHDTVGAVALCRGATAAATSTGGITGKQPGRVGDTPIVGSGGYADNSLGAVSTTGELSSFATK